jgi:trk system potassium uptake protein TrkA
MKIIILGAGQVGRTVAQRLAGEVNDITVVDQDPRSLEILRDMIDIRTVTGKGSYPNVLLRAGIEETDLLLAVTSSDETNMIACQIAYTLFHTPIRLARIRSPAYFTHKGLFTSKAVPINYIISPEQMVTTAIKHLIEQTGALQVLDFAEGKAQLVAVRATSGGPLVGHELRSLPHRIPGIETRVVAIFRRDCAVIPEGGTVIEAHDEVFFLAAHRDIPSVLKAFRPTDRPNTRVIIAGGGNIGKRTAELIEETHRTKVIEHDLLRCRHLAESLHRSIILYGDAGDADLLTQEYIQDTDIFCSLTNSDATNILSGMLAKRLGVRKVLAIINQPGYVNMAQGNAVDIAISPAQVTIGALLARIRRGDVVAVHSLRSGAAEAIEIIAHGDRQHSHVVGRRIDELPLPQDTIIGAIARGDGLIFPHRDTVIEAEDRVILFLADQRRIIDVERLFQVAITFL